MADKKPFFLKRWILSLNALIDSLFGCNTEETGKVLMPLWPSLLAGLAGGLVGGLLSLFVKDQEQVMSIAVTIVLVISLGFSVYNLVKTLKEVPSVGKKIGRSAVIVILGLILACLGFFIGFWLAFLVIVALVLFLIYEFTLADVGKKRKVKLDDGTDLTITKGLTGEDIIEGSDGRSYRKNSDGTFSPN